MPKDSWLQKLIFMAADMGMKCIAMFKWVMQHIKTISIKRQRGAMYNKQKFSNPKKLILIRP